MTKRGKLEIVKDILTIIKSNPEIKPTPLLRKSNLSTKRYNQYYSEILSGGLIKKEGKKTILTEKGYHFLEKYKTIITFINEFGL
jgi:predicted transcriptional regulator